MALAARLRPAWPCIHEMSLWLSRRLPGGADQVIGMNKGGTVEVGGPAGLDGPAPTTRPATGTRRRDHAATWASRRASSIELENGFRVYHAGDTAVFGDMALIRELFRPDLAMLPIGGHFTMDPAAAAVAVGAARRRHVLPIHWGTFPILAGTPAALRARVVARGASGRRCTTGGRATRSLRPDTRVVSRSRCARRRRQRGPGTTVSNPSSTSCSATRRRSMTGTPMMSLISTRSCVPSAYARRSMVVRTAP